MPRVFVVAIAFAGMVAIGALTATAQDDTPAAGHGGGHARTGTPAADSPSAGRVDPAAAIRSLTPEQIAQVERGEGAGFALPAELNGVPGPRHVLDLAHDLGLSPEQTTRVQTISDEMRAAVIPAGQRYLAAVRSLEEDFRAGTLTDADLPGRVADVARLEGELAAAHLSAHLKTVKLLTPEQTATYKRLRGYE